MKQLVILSGKGGTGKTSISAAFAQLSYCTGGSPMAVFVDADVDAANLSLVLQPQRPGCTQVLGRIAGRD